MLELLREETEKTISQKTQAQEALSRGMPQLKNSSDQEFLGSGVPTSKGGEDPRVVLGQPEQCCRPRAMI